MGASEVVIKVTGEDTGGAFFIAEVVLEAGFPGPPPHYHERLHETLYLLAGEVTMTLDGREEVLRPGGFASIPPGVVHTFRNDGAEPARALNVNAPAGWEHYLRELAAAASARRPHAGAHDRDRVPARLPPRVARRRNTRARCGG